MASELNKVWCGGRFHHIPSPGRGLGHKPSLTAAGTLEGASIVRNLRDARGSAAIWPYEVTFPMLDRFPRKVREKNTGIEAGLDPARAR